MVDFWVMMGISIVRTLLTQLHLDTTKQSVYRTVLLDLANGIYLLFGATPPAPPAA